MILLPDGSGVLLAFGAARYQVILVDCFWVWSAALLRQVAAPATIPKKLYPPLDAPPVPPGYHPGKFITSMSFVLLLQPVYLVPVSRIPADAMF